MNSKIKNNSTKRPPKKYGICRKEGCPGKAFYNFHGSKTGIYCSEHQKKGMRDLSRKKCLKDNCIRKPSFNYPGIKPGIYCSEHKENGMENVTSTKCLKEGCGRVPEFNFKGIKRGLYCSEHKENGMENVVKTKCSKEGCIKLPSFNFPEEERAIYCSEHKLDGMENITKRNCDEKGCTISGSYGYVEETKVIGKRKKYCFEHKKEGMELLRRKCLECKLQPSFNFPGETQSIYCSEHKKEGMEDVLNDKCLGGCGKYPSFNYEGIKKPIYCFEHKKDGMVSTIVSKCITEGCTITAAYNLFGQKPAYCYEHKPRGAIVRPNPRCSKCTDLATQGVTEPVNCKFHREDGQKSLYEEKCVKCKHYLILDVNKKCCDCSGQRKPFVFHAKEKQVRDYFDANDLKYALHDSIVSSGFYGKLRPDFVFKEDTHSVVVEVDERRHVSYSKECEEERMKNISRSLGTKTLFIRYNPDKYRKGSQRYLQMNEDINERLKVLREQLEFHLKNVPDNYLSVQYLFYDDDSHPKDLQAIPC